MANRRNILQSLRHRASGIGRLLLPALAATLICPAGAVCADLSAALPIATQGSMPLHASHSPSLHDHGAPTHGHELPAGDRDVSSSDQNGDYCPHCDVQASAMSSARTACDVAAEDAPPPAKLPHDLHLTVLPAATPAAPADPHPSPPRTAYSTGSGPPAIPLNLLHCVLLI